MAHQGNAFQDVGWQLIVLPPGIPPHRQAQLLRPHRLGVARAAQHKRLRWSHRQRGCLCGAAYTFTDWAVVMMRLADGLQAEKRGYFVQNR